MYMHSMIMHASKTPPVNNQIHFPKPCKTNNNTYNPPNLQPTNRLLSIPIPTPRQMRPHTNLPIPNLSSPLPLNPLLNPSHTLLKSHLHLLPVTPHPNIPPRNPKLDEPEELFRQHQKLHLIPGRIMFGMTVQQVSLSCVCGRGGGYLQ